MWEYRKHQIEGAAWVLSTLREYGLAYLHWQERTNKTGTALLAVENSTAKTCLVVTKKKAIAGWEEHLANLPLTKDYTIINYESIHKVKGEFDIVLLDESHHAISSTGRPSKTWKAVSKYTHKKPIVYLSATGYSESLGLIYHQLKLSHWTPFKCYKNFYEWFRMYGISKMTRTPYGLVETYSKYKDELILKSIDHLFNFKTRAEVGIEHEPTVNIIKVPLLATTKKLMEDLITRQMINIDGVDIICDTPMKTMVVHYQLENGAVKTEDGYVVVGNEKADYIKARYNPLETVIMSHFIGERARLKELLPDFTILSAESYSEGIDLSHVEKLVFTSTSFKTSKYTQRLSRQSNHNRATPIVVDILVGDTGIGSKIIDAVAIKKVNFDSKSYQRIR